MTRAQQGVCDFVVVTVPALSVCVCVPTRVHVGPSAHRVIELFIRKDSVCVCVCRCVHPCVCIEASLRERVTSFTCAHLDIFSFFITVNVA